MLTLTMMFLEDVYVPGKFKGSRMSINIEQHGDDYIRLNADLAMRPQISSKDQLKCMYSECFDGIGEFNDFEYHIEL